MRKPSQTARFTYLKTKTRNLFRYLSGMFSNCVVALPALVHIGLFFQAKNRNTITADLLRYLPKEDHALPIWKNLAFVLREYPEFRNIFYFRLAGFPKKKTSLFFWLATKLCPPMDTLHLCTPEVGPGLFVQHGFATIVVAKKIGKNCWINQQVTVGYNSRKLLPIIGDNVTIHAGGKVIGGVTLHDHVTVGANAVVVKNVPAYATVVGVPAYIIKIKDKRIRRKLT